MKAKATDLVRRIQGTATVTDTMKVMAGVTVYKTTRTPSPARVRLSPCTMEQHRSDHRSDNDAGGVDAPADG